MVRSGHLISSVEVAENVDLLTLILLRMPPRSLVRFKCVSRHWFALISDSKFANNHTRMSLKHKVSGLYKNPYPLISFEKKSSGAQFNLPTLDFLSTLDRLIVRILHSCNGLTLCSQGSYQSELVVCNLTTQKFKVLPKISRPSFRSTSAEMFLAFNPMTSPHYKVIFLNTFPYSIAIDVYSSDTGMWKDIHINEPEVYSFTGKVLCDGAIYWMIKNNLARFDINKESFKTIQIPTEPVYSPAKYTFWYFGECDGRLLLIQTETSKETDYLIFEMDMQNFSWNLKYSVDVGESMNTISSCLRRYPCSMEVLYFKGGDEEETPALILAYHGSIISYNPNNSHWEILLDLPDEIQIRMARRTKEYIQSMASV